MTDLGTHVMFSAIDLDNILILINKCLGIEELKQTLCLWNFYIPMPSYLWLQAPIFGDCSERLVVSDFIG